MCWIPDPRPTSVKRRNIKISFFLKAERNLQETNIGLLVRQNKERSAIGFCRFNLSWPFVFPLYFFCFRMSDILLLSQLRAGVGAAAREQKIQKSDGWV